MSYNFLARLGRSKIGQFFFPAVSVITTTGYITLHTYSFNLIKNVLTVQTADGQKDRISDELKELIVNVRKDLDEKSNFMKSSVTINGKTRVGNPNFNWFCSSTMEPILFGSIHLKTGVLIGLPSYYKYKSVEELSDDIFKINKIAFIKTSTKEEQSEKNDSAKLLHEGSEDTCSQVNVKTIDRNSDLGKEYAETFILSENAKKFSIAKELFGADSFLPLYKTFVILCSFILAASTGRGAVMQMKLRNNHVSQRVPVYLLSGSFGLGTWYLLNQAIDTVFRERHDKFASQLGDDYKAGFEEYYRKKARRTEIITERRN